MKKKRAKKTQSPSFGNLTLRRFRSEKKNLDFKERSVAEFVTTAVTNKVLEEKNDNYSYVTAGPSVLPELYTIE